MLPRVLAVLGTRPEAIKMAPVLDALKDREDVEVVVCSTGQHREMLDPLLGLFGIEPDHDLSVMAEDQTPVETFTAVMDGLDTILEHESPDWLLLQGDTSTVAAGSLAGFYNRIQVAHLEAGLRTGDKWNPFPEEINRRVAGVAADRHFAPTREAAENLRREDVPRERITVTGNTVVDALQEVVKQEAPGRVDELVNSGKRTVLVTAHRRENHGAPLKRICSALAELARDEDIQVVFPVHLNPNVRDPVHQALEGVDGVRLVPPLDYPVLVHLMDASGLVLTDSGGIQEEAPAMGTPVLVLRDTTERPEGVEAGTAKVVGTRVDDIVDEARHLLSDPEAHAAMAEAPNPYGDGRASQRVARALAGEPVEEFTP